MRGRRYCDVRVGMRVYSDDRVGIMGRGYTVMVG